MLDEADNFDNLALGDNEQARPGQMVPHEVPLADHIEQNAGRWEPVAEDKKTDEDEDDGCDMTAAETDEGPVNAAAMG